MSADLATAKDIVLPRNWFAILLTSRLDPPAVRHIQPTGGHRIMSGRPEFCVFCTKCQQTVHEYTNGPGYMIEPLWIIPFLLDDA